MTACDRIAAGFGIQSARTLVVRPLQDAQLSVVHLERVYEDDDAPVVLPPEDAFLVMLYLVDVQHSDLWPDRPPSPLKTYEKGTICLVSLKGGASISVRGYLDALAFHIPSAHFVELSREAGEPLVDYLQTCRGSEDPVIWNLGSALLPMFDLPDEVKDVLLPHVGLAMVAHLAHRYGQPPIRPLSEPDQPITVRARRAKGPGAD
ncbi:hypothetical protein J2858_004032 [Neorhizobium galegae]|uniref:hypothetical protein n=1 Tax=Neorhizobium galegae TaxID=399 RepID=UPI001AE16189|nr:hypothetical protein [Neorhizobium galegae]MBP2551092.1 hypothetical protein [Neorhizobium galegae]